MGYPPEAVLDRGFYTGRVLRDLIMAEVPLLMPAVKRGQKPTTAGGPTGTSAVAAKKQRQWPTDTLKRSPDGQVACDLAVVCPNTRGKRGHPQREALLDAPWGLTHRALRWMRDTYRRRFGLESSYRQSPPARIRPSRRTPALRRLFLGVALVLRTVWVWLHAEVRAQPQRGARPLRPPSLRFARLLVWPIREGARHSRLVRKLPVCHDLYERAPAFGIVFNY